MYANWVLLLLPPFLQLVLVALEVVAQGLRRAHRHNPSQQVGLKTGGSRMHTTLFTELHTLECLEELVNVTEPLPQ